MKTFWMLMCLSAACDAAAQLASVLSDTDK